MYSKFMGGHQHPFVIYLPPSYYSSTDKQKRYPTLYLLHGSPGLVTDWIKAGDAANSANALIITKKIQELIMVMPDGNGALGATSEWGNSGNHKQLMESYVSGELVHYIDQHFRTIPNAAHRAIGGLSMGGFGAMNIAIHHPNVFASVIALGGYYKATGTVWGSNRAYIHYNSPIIQIGLQPQAHQLHIFLGDAYEDKPYYTDTIHFAQRLKQLDMKYTFVKDHGHHSWRVWATLLYQGLTWLHWSPIHAAPLIAKRM
jgi:S-formylglutathione hydrolase FrmB